MNIGNLLADQLDRLLHVQVDAGRLASIEAGNDNTRLWSSVAELGAQHAMIGGDMGAGLSWQECLPVFQVLGWHGGPVPLAETMLANRALSDSGLEPLEGPVAVCSGVFELGSDQSVQGEDALVPWLPIADTVVGVALRKAQPHVFVLTTAELAFEPLETLARIPSARLSLVGMRTDACGPASHEISDLGMKPQLALLRSIQISALLGRILDLTVEYANTRNQFGRPIGKFQAIQHLVADLAVQAATAQAAASYGCRAMDANNMLEGAAVAKCLASSAAGEAARIAHQVFGAIGITEEHELHHLTRRLWQWRQEAGSEFEWSEWLGQGLLDGGGENLWPALVGERFPLS